MYTLKAKATEQTIRMPSWVVAAGCVLRQNHRISGAVIVIDIRVKLVFVFVVYIFFFPTLQFFELFYLCHYLKGYSAKKVLCILLSRRILWLFGFCTVWQCHPPKHIIHFNRGEDNNALLIEIDESKIEGPTRLYWMWK